MIFFLYWNRFSFFFRSQITHVWHNEMQRTVQDHKEHDELRGCFYRGRVRTDDRSAVAVSLCDGMVSDKTYLL